jgi:hypothetical protein
MPSNFTFEFRTGPNTSFEKGSQVFLNYGKRENLKLLRIYGFCIPFNPCDFSWVFKMYPRPSNCIGKTREAEANEEIYKMKITKLNINFFGYTEGLSDDCNVGICANILGISKVIDLK